MIRNVMGHFEEGKIGEDEVRQLERRENKIDRLQNDITNYLVELTKRELTTSQADIVPILMHCTNDAERIADHCENIVSLIHRIKKTKAKLSADGEKEINEMWSLLSDQAKNVIGCLTDSDPDNITMALKDEKKIDKMADKFERRHMRRLTKGECDPASGVIFLEMISELERVGDHLSNIAERAPKIRAHYFELLR